MDWSPLDKYRAQIVGPYVWDGGLCYAHFLAQCAHESGGFKYLEEIWGPTEAQKHYDTHPGLGNTQPGDGYKYRGRGWLQLTGRANYREFGVITNYDLEKFPDAAARPEAAARIAGAYWYRKGCNKFALADDLEAVTRLVNGGLTGLEDRRRYLNLAKEFLCLPTKSDVPNANLCSRLPPSV